MLLKFTYNPFCFPPLYTSLSGIHWICYELTVSCIEKGFGWPWTFSSAWGDTCHSLWNVRCEPFSRNYSLTLQTWKSLQIFPQPNVNSTAFVSKRANVSGGLIVVVVLSWWRKVELSWAVPVLESGLQNTNTKITRCSNTSRNQVDSASRKSNTDWSITQTRAQVSSRAGSKHKQRGQVCSLWRGDQLLFPNANRLCAQHKYDFRTFEQGHTNWSGSEKVLLVALSSKSEMGKGTLRRLLLAICFPLHQRKKKPRSFYTNNLSFWSASQSFWQFRTTILWALCETSAKTYWWWRWGRRWSKLYLVVVQREFPKVHHQPMNAAEVQILLTFYQ